MMTPEETNHTLESIDFLRSCASSYYPAEIIADILELNLQLAANQLPDRKSSPIPAKPNPAQAVNWPPDLEVSLIQT